MDDPSVTPDKLAWRARLAAHKAWTPSLKRRGTSDPLERFERQVREENPDLSEPAVHRRAVHLQKAHQARMALNSARARRQRKDKD